MSSTPLFKIFTNNPSLPQYPHLQAALFAFADPLTSHSLACTCTRYRSLEELHRRAKLTLDDIDLNVGQPGKAWVACVGARKEKGGEIELARVWREADEEDLKTVVQRGKRFSCYEFEGWPRPEYLSEAAWRKESGYKGVKIDSGATLFSRGGILRTRCTEESPLSSSKHAGFTLKDVRDLYVGRYAAQDLKPRKLFGLIRLKPAPRTKFYNNDPEIHFDKHARSKDAGDRSSSGVWTFPFGM